MDQNKRIADAFVVEHGGTSAEYLGEWKGYDCYRPKLKVENGYLAPIIILVKDGVAREADIDEELEIPY